VCLNSSAPNESLLLGHIKRVRRSKRRKISVKRLSGRKRLFIREKECTQRSRRGLFSVNYAKQPTERQKKLTRHKKRSKERRNAPRKSKINKQRLL
jgi:hypothetical protein